jgi:hypothetical protein
MTQNWQAHRYREPLNAITVPTVGIIFRCLEFEKTPVSKRIFSPNQISIGHWISVLLGAVTKSAGFARP